MAKSERSPSVSTMQIAMLLLVSGACSLVFQVVWIRELRLIFGATTSASSAVLAIFMGGLGLGNAVLGKRIDAISNPLRTYAWLEAGIALFAAISPFLIDATRAIYIGIGGQQAMGTATATGFRLISSIIVLGMPTFLMGGTLPAAARTIASDDDPRRRRVALLYGLNTIGAVTGAFLANFWLIELWGNRGLLWTACAANLILVATAFLLASPRFASSTAALPITAAPVSVTKEIDVKPQSQNSPAIIYSTSALVGFVFFLMEIVWYRMLGPLLGGTTYTFGLILCLALLGIGIGGAFYNFLAKWLKPNFALLAVTCSLEAFLIILPYWFGDEIAIWVLRQYETDAASFAEQVWDWSKVGAFVILPASLVAGFQFPLLIAVAGTGEREIGKQVGTTFAANTVGAIAGAMAGGFLLLPILTAPGLWRVATGLLVLATVALVLYQGRGNRGWSAAALLFVVLAIFGCLGDGPTAAWRHSGIGAGRAELIGKERNDEQAFTNDARRRVVWETEGLESSIAIAATDSLSFAVNGKIDGNAHGDAGTQIGLGLLGPLLHPSPQRGLVIGLGTGESAGWLADCDFMTNVDVVELEPKLVEMARRCSSVNRDALNNPKLLLHFNDAREFLLTNKDTYHLIVSEPSNPYRAGIANLYTLEFYQAAANSMTDDGLFLQWLQGYEVSEDTVSIVLRTLRQVFPSVEVWRTKARDMVLVCRKLDVVQTFNSDLIAQRLRDSGTIRDGLRWAWRVDDVEGVLARFVCGKQAINRWLENNPSPTNRDDRNLLEYAFAQSVGKRTRFSVEDLASSTQGTEEDLSKLEAGSDQFRIARRRLAMHLHLGGEVPQVSIADEQTRTRAEAYQFYLTKSYRDALTRFESFSFDADCSVDRLVYAHSLVENGQLITRELLDVIRTHEPGEGFAIEAIQLLKQGDFANGRSSMQSAFQVWRENPWALPQIMDALLRYAVSLGEIDKKSAGVSFDQLSQPFAMYRMEEKRVLTRYVLAESIGMPAMLDALGEMEPHVPWRGWLLESRAAVYAANRHPRMNKAFRDWQQFQKFQNEN